MASSTEKSHDHYGPEVKKALAEFRDMWLSYHKILDKKLKYDGFRIDSLQNAWNKLAIARQKETGTGFYLTPEQYNNVHNR
jgi:hypothetical protein